VEKKSILIVDDDRTILRSLREILEFEGYSVETVQTGQEAIEKSKTEFYNLALLDIKLPDMEGTKLLEAMHETSPRMVKIMVTGYPALQNAVEALNMGADAYLMKPVHPQRMLKVVEEKLKEQEEAKSMTEEKVAQWIETRVKKLESERYKKD
jgi:DNA-binding NtrC family response regulator